MSHLSHTIAVFIALASIAVGGCSEDPTTPTVVGTATGADAAGSDASLGDGAAAGNDGGASDAATGGDSAGAAGDAAVVDTAAPDTTAGSADGVVASDGAAADADAQSAKYPVCSQLLTCVAVACGGEPPGSKCGEPCMAGGSDAAKAAIAPYLGCVNQYCTLGLCAGNPTAQCMSDCSWSKCMAKALKCGADGASGAGVCISAFGCLDGCKDKGLACLFGCYAALDKSAQAQFDALTDCATAAGGTDPFAQCPGQAMTCMSAGKSGSGDCMNLILCADGCNAAKNDGEKMACLGGCWGNATAAAQQAWLEVAKCNDKPSSNCPQALTTCIPPGGAKTCLDTLGCWDACDKAVPKDAKCPFACLQAASPAEGPKVAALIYCMNAKCATCKGDKSCQDACVKDKCATEWKACLAP